MKSIEEVPTFVVERVFIVGDVVWVRCYRTYRSALGVVRNLGDSVDGSKPLAAVEITGSYYDWDGEAGLINANNDERVLVVEQFRLEKITW